MITLTKEWLLKTIAELEEERDAVPGAVNEDAALALSAMKRALASLEAEPVSWTDEQELRDVEKFGCAYQFTVNPITPNADPRRVIMLYAAPQLPQPAVPETLPCPVMLEPGLRFGKGVRTQTMLDALQRRAEYSAGLEAMTPEQRSDHEAGMKEFAAMLQGAEPVTTAYKLPDAWVACSERMPDIGTEIFYFCQDDGRRDCAIVCSSNFSGKGDAELYVHAEGYDLRFGVDITHWMPLPSAPQ